MSMEPTTLTYLLGLAGTTGVIHTLMGPDHYVPFVAMARARDWSLSRTLAITLACGVGHVLGSLILGAVGIAVGMAVGGLDAFESARSHIAAWLMLGFGLAYTVWGVQRAIRNKPHRHFHVHADGTVHDHRHTHADDHAHVHDARVHTADDNPASITPWVLFTIFVFGACEPLIPQLMYPAAQGSWWALALVVGVFAFGTLSTMTLCVAVGYLGLAHLSLKPLERYAHAAAGLAVTACGLAIMLGL